MRGHGYNVSFDFAPLCSPEVVTDFAYFTKDRPWLKGLLVLELLTLVSLTAASYNTHFERLRNDENKSERAFMVSVRQPANFMLLIPLAADVFGCLFRAASSSL